MTSVRRWLAVLAGTAMLVTLPSVVGAVPATRSDLSAAVLLQRIQHSQGVGYSGYVQSSGGLALPVTSQFSGIADLFGGQTELRVWWRSAHDWRVDSIGLSGETDVHATSAGFWTWNYEADTATFTRQPISPEIRLPTDADLLPPQLAGRLLSEVTAAQASRLPSVRVAGRSAPGLRVRPADPRSTIDHIDVWANAATGLPLRVDVVGKQGASAAISTSFLDVAFRTPAERTTTFWLPPGANVATVTSPDLATTIDQLGGGSPPAELAGMQRNAMLPQLGSVGVYGQGVTEFVAVPLPRRTAYSLRRQLAPAAGQSASSIRSDPNDLVLSMGPLNLLLTSFENPAGPWLLVGTVTSATLSAAAEALATSSGPR